MGSNHHKWVQVAQPVLKQTRLSFVIAAILTSAQLYAKNLEVNLPKQPLPFSGWCFNNRRDPPPIPKAGRKF